MISLNYHAEISNEVLGQRAKAENYSELLCHYSDGICASDQCSLAPHCG